MLSPARYWRGRTVFLAASPGQKDCDVSQDKKQQDDSQHGYDVFALEIYLVAGPGFLSHGRSSPAFSGVYDVSYFCEESL